MWLARLVRSAALACVLVLPGVLLADGGRLVCDGVVATGACSAPLPMDPVWKVKAHVYRKDNAAAATATVILQVCNNATPTACYTVATITNPTGLDATTKSGGEAWTGSAAGYLRAYVTTWGAGQISVNLQAWNAQGAEVW